MNRIILTAACLLAASTALAKKTPTTKKATTKPDPSRELCRAVRREFKPLIENIRSGQINWTTGEIIAVGTAKSRGPSDGQAIAMALRGARVVAARNAVLATGGIRVGPDGRFNIKHGDVKVDAVLKNFREVSSHYDPKKRTATVKLALPIYGAQGLVTIRGLKIHKPRRRGQNISVMRGKADAVVIDARGTGFAPSLTPQLLSQDQKVLFRAADALKKGQSLDRPAAIYVFMKQTGVKKGTKAPIIKYIGHAKAVTERAGRIDPKLIERAKRCFKRPLILVAEKTAEKDPCSLILTPAAFKNLCMHGEAMDLMKAGKLVIVTDMTE